MNERIREEILGAVARGWCTEQNSCKAMDPELAVSIASEVEILVEATIEECIEQVYPLWIKSHHHINPVNLADAVARIKEHFGVH